MHELFDEECGSSQSTIQHHKSSLLQLTNLLCYVSLILITKSYFHSNISEIVNNFTEAKSWSYWHLKNLIKPNFQTFLFNILLNFYNYVGMWYFFISAKQCFTVDDWRNVHLGKCNWIYPHFYNLSSHLYKILKELFDLILSVLLVSSRGK